MEFITPSGKKAVINPAPFQDSMALKQSIAAVIATSPIKIDIDFASAKNGDISNIDFDVAEIAKLIALIDASPLIQEKLFTCLIRCTHNGEKITMATFEPEDARQDYYDIVLACLKVNIAPFFKGLLSKFAPLMEAFTARVQANKSEKILQ